MSASTITGAFDGLILPAAIAIRGRIDDAQVRRREREMRANPVFTRPAARWVEGESISEIQSRIAANFGLSGKPKRPMASRLIERGLRIRIVTGFTLVILLTLAIAGWSIYHISTLGTAAEHLFIENYRTIGYMHTMESAIASVQEDGPQAFPGNDVIVRRNLALEYANITEAGELDAVKKLDFDYARYANAPTKELADQVRADCEVVLGINERAMFSRSEAFRSQGDFARNSTVVITFLLVGMAVFLAVAVSRRSLAEFQELDRAKSNFVAIAAHELKNPLAHIKTTSGMLADGIAGPLSQKQSDLVSSIRSETGQLHNLVRELLDLARLEAGTLHLHGRMTDVETLIESAMLPIALKSEEAGVAIDVVMAEPVPEVFVDPNKMAWAIGNLLSNAIRYSPRGASVVVNASIIETEVWISVADKGKGIAESDLTRIFDKFVQVEEGAMGGGSGSGLGLAIAREIVQAHGGRIWATSKLNAGSTFTIALPLSITPKYPK